MTSLYDIPLVRLNGDPDHMANYRGRALLVVNVASRCGFTPQYEGLESLYQTFHDKGFDILAFPCNQFGSQEPGTAEEIATFCSGHFGVSFPVFQKTDVNGAKTHPLYAHLKTKAPGLLGSESIKWNFTKFLVSADGARINRFAPTDTPNSLIDAVRAALPSLN